MAAYFVAMNGDPVVESVDLAEVGNAVATTPAATPDLATGQTKALSPTLDNAPILHIKPLTSTNSTFLHLPKLLAKVTIKGSGAPRYRPDPSPKCHDHRPAFST